MTLEYEQVCDILKQVISFTNCPKPEINSEVKCTDSQLYGKIVYKYDCSLNKGYGMPRKHKLTCLGSCEIGNLNGNEIIRLFFEIFRKIEFENGNFLCFSLGGEICAAIWFYKNSFHTVTLSPPDGSEFKQVYTLLFNDGKIECNKQNGSEPNPTDEDLQLLRHKAKVEFPRFMKTKFSQFGLHPFGVAFLGLAVDIANHSRGNYFLNSAYPDLKNIPLQACIKLAFDYDQTGKVTQLFGEIGLVENISKELVQQLKADLSCATARELINNIADENGEFQNNKVLEVVQEIKQIFQIDDDETTS